MTLRFFPKFPSWAPEEAYLQKRMPGSFMCIFHLHLTHVPKPQYLLSLVSHIVLICGAFLSTTQIGNSNPFFMTLCVFFYILSSQSSNPIFFLYKTSWLPFFIVIPLLPPIIQTIIACHVDCGNQSSSLLFQDIHMVLITLLINDCSISPLTTESSTILILMFNTLDNLFFRLTYVHPSLLQSWLIWKHNLDLFENTPKRFCWLPLYLWINIPNPIAHFLLLKSFPVSNTTPPWNLFLPSSYLPPYCHFFSNCTSSIIIIICASFPFS